MTSENRPLVIGLIVVQIALSASLWVLNVISVSSTAAFDILLAADVLIFAVICHLAFRADDEAAERDMPIPPSFAMLDEEPMPEEVHQEEPHAPQPLLDVPTVLSSRIRLGVPAFSAAMLVLLAALVASGRGTTDVFIPIFIFMVIVYVLSSIYFFKALLERDRSTAVQPEEGRPAGLHASGS